MKSLSIELLTEMAKQQGSEPLTVVGVQWKDGDAYVIYADKQLPGVHGRLEQIGTISHKLSLQSINSSTVEVTVSDVDNMVHDLYESFDLHKRPCFVWQYFGNLTPDDKFIIFQGLTNSPIVWSESNRNISFSVISEIEAREVGFSPEEANYDFVSHDAIGKAWPMCFGDVLHVPAVKSRATPSGTLQTRLGIVDPILFYKIDVLNNAYFQQIFIYNYYKALGARIESSANNAFQQAASFFAQLNTIVNGGPTTPLQKTTEAYCWIIGQEDAYKEGLVKLQQKVDQKKADIAAMKAGQMNPGNRTLKQHQADLKDMRARLRQAKRENRDIIKSKKIIEKWIDQLEHEMELQKDYFAKQTEAYNTIVGIYNQYLQVIDEVCYQRQLEKTELLISGGEFFPQNTDVDLLINGLRVRGAFHDERMFTVKTLIPTYKNVTLGQRQNITNDCNDDRNWNQSQAVFWVDDIEINMRDQWALVLDRRGRYHVIHIIDQIGTKCIFDLTQPGNDFTGSSGSRNGKDLFSSPVEFPLYQGPLGNFFTASTHPVFNLPGGKTIAPFDYANYNIYTSEFIDSVNSALRRYGAAPLDSDEIENLKKLQSLYTYDRAEDYLFFDEISPRDIFNLLGEDILRIVEVAPMPLANWLKKDIEVSELPDTFAWDAEPGTTVYDFNSTFDVYVANILPSTVYCVHAYRKNSVGDRYLEVVPTDYYSLNESEQLSDNLTVTSLRFRTPLTSIQGENWEDEVYVSLRSSVGNNIVDILIYLIQTYTTKDYDTVSFDEIRTTFADKYPANFAIFDRRDVLRFISEIAFQSRCAISLVNDIFYLYYLAREPEAVKTFANKDVETGSLNLTYTETENLVTKLTAHWQETYLPDQIERKFVLRHNIHKYGLHEQEMDFYIYNIGELVEKSATFWLIRFANTWKYVTFDSFIEHLDLELYDCLFLNIQHVPFEKGLIESINYDPNTKRLGIACWIPIKAGQNVKYPFAWPADQVLSFPLPGDDAGGVLKNITKHPGFISTS